jgi:hypothetical protein
MNVDEEESFVLPTPSEDAYPPSTYTIQAPEDPVFFAGQQIEPVTPSPEDPTGSGLTFYQTDIVPIPADEAEGLSDIFIPTDPSGAEVPSSTSVTSISPNTNIPYEGGTVCDVTGVALDAVAYVRIFGRDILFTTVNPTWIQFTAPLSPDAAPGTKSVDFFNVYNVLLASYDVTYDPQIVSYGLTGVSASTGTILGNEVLTIFGTALYYIQSVTICGQPVANFEQTSYNTIEVVTAPGAFTGIAGNIVVRNYDGVDATLFGAFTYTYPAPFILGLSANSGDVSGGTQIEVAGAYFNGTTSVTIGGSPVDFFIVNNSTSIVLFTAPGTYSGLALDVVVTSPNGSGTLFSAFTYTTMAPAPIVRVVSASSGFFNELNTIQITGQDFIGTTDVLIGGVPAVSFNVVSNTSITAVVTSSGPYTGNFETCTVVNTYGSGSKAGVYAFVYRPPTVTSTTLTSDLVSGGTNGTLYGTNFYNVTAVTLAGVPVNSFVVVSPTQIDYVTGTSPNSFTNGAVQVITDFGTATLENIFSYVYPPVTISNTSTNIGFASGGTTVIITGTGFTLVTNVLIAGVGAASFTVDSLTQITAVTAPNGFPTNLPGDVAVLTTFSQAVLPNAFTYVPSMFLTSSSVSSGVTTGGESGTLTGSQFANIANVLVVGTAVQSFTLVNSTTITFVTGTTGQYGVLGSIVIVTTFGEYITLPNAFTYYPPLVVTSVGSPSASGIDTGGESRSISGSGFYSVTSVLIGGVPVQSFTVISVNDIHFVTAPSASIGQKDVTVVTTYLTQTLTNGFTYYPNMTITSLSTSSGTSSGGTNIIITGTGFFSVNSVTFNGTAVASFVVNSLTQITAVTASKVLSDGELGDVVISSPFDSATLSNSWTYWPPMSVASLDISNGSRVGGTTVVIAGSGFYAVAGVTFNGVSVTSYTVDSPSQITVSTGVGTANGTGNVVVSSIYTSATKTNAWTYWPVMSVSSLDVSNGSTVGGTTVVLTGAGFFSVSSVTFNGIVAASFTVDSLTQITAVTSSKVSNGDVGNVVVTSPYTSATKSNAWTYWPPMSVSSLSVSNGSTVGNTTVVITGAGFYSVTGITFNGVAVSSFTVNSITQITVTTAAGTSNGTGNVVVTSNFTSATGTNLWTYWQPVVVSSLDVTNGPRAGGTTVVVTGSGFYSVSGVTFNGVAVTSYTVDSLTQITVSTGAKLSSNGDVGAVVVTTTYTSGTKSSAWTYWPPMGVTSLNVSNGSKVGGTTVLITGTGFYSVTGVTFNGDAVSSFTVDSVTQITVVTGAGSANGTGNVVVTSNFTSATGTSLWTYWPPMAVTSLDVTSGSFVGGTAVNVTGTGFWNVSGITIKGVPVRSFTVNSETSATIVTDANMADLMNTWTSVNLQNIFTSNSWGPLEYSSASGEAIVTNATSTSTVTTARILRSNTTRSVTNATENNRWGHIIYVSQISKYVAVSLQASTSNYVATSTDGITWTPKAGQSGSWRQVVYAPSLSMLVAIATDLGSTQAVMTSTDGGDTWTLQTTPTITNSTWRSITWSPTLSKFLAVGHNNDFTVTGIGIAMTSSDGVTWTEISWDTVVPKITGRGSQAFFVEWSEELLIFCVTGNVSSYASPDGTTWSRGDITGSDMSTSYLKYVSDIKRFVCTQAANVTDTYKIRWSSDGINWTAGSITADQVNGWTYMPNRKTFIVKNLNGLTFRVAQPAVATGNVVFTSTYTSATKTNGFSYVPEVCIEGTQTTYGDIAGGSSFKIEGIGFTSVSSVTVGGVAVTSYTVDSTKQITAVAPAGTLGAKDIVVTTSFGSATLSNGFRYISVPTPTQYTLDNVSTTSIQFAFANRIISSTYTGPLYSVRRSTDNVWTRVYEGLITDSGEILTAWLGGATAYLNIWYDQSGLASSYAYRYTLDQPILNASTGVVDMTGAIATQLNISASTVLGDTPYTMVVRHGTTVNTNPGDYFSFGTGSATGHGVILRRSATTKYQTLWYSTGLATYQLIFGTYAAGNSVSTTYDLTTARGYVNGVLKNSSAPTASLLNIASSASAIGSGGANRARAEYYSLYAFANVLTNTERVWLEADGVDMTITSTSVSNGTTSGGTTVVITGTGFYGVDTVSFGGVNAASFTIDSPTQITAVTASTTAVGAVGDIVVTSPIDSATSTNGWTYWPPMSFTSINVANGITTGGTTVVVTGAGFYAVSSVTFGGTAVASYTVDSATQITVSTGVSSLTAPTLGNVVVTSPYTSTTGSNVWTYYPPIVVSSLDVTYGNVSGGTTVNITGSGFYNVNSVTFKGIEVRSKTVNSPTSMTVVTKGDVTQLIGRNSWMGTGPPTTNFISGTSFHCWAGGSIQKFIVPGAYVYTSSDAVTFTVADVPTPGTYRFAMYVPSLAKAFVLGNGNFADRFIESTDGITWTSPGVIPFGTAYNWNWMAYSPTLDIFVVVNRPSSAVATPFAVSTDRGATWTEYGTGTPQSFSTVVWCSAIGKFVASGFANVSVGIVAYSSDGINWTEVNLGTLFPSASIGLGQTASVSEDLGLVFFSSAANVFTWDGTTWQVGTVTAQINNPVWVSNLQLFVGVINASTYASSPDGLVWTNISTNSTGMSPYGSFAYSPEMDLFLSTGTGSSYNFTNANISTNGSVVVTSTYTSGTKTNAWSFVPTMAISDVDIGYGPTAGGTVVKIYGRGFRNINPGSVTFNGVQATSFTADGVHGTILTATVAAGTAGTGNVVCANSFRNATLTNGWSYKNTTVSSYPLDALSSGALSSVQLAFNTKPVRSTYTGPLFRVWRDSDCAWTDVYATSGNSSDWFTKNGITLATFKGSATLRVVRWFDQSGNATGTDGAIPKPPNSGPVFGYAYQPRYMPVLDLTNNCLDFSGGSRFMRLQDSVTTSGDVSHTITVRHGTTGNSTNGEYFNIGTNSTTPPGNGHNFRRSGSDYIDVWSGNATLTLTGAYADNQVVTIVYDKTGLLRTGYVQGTSAGSLAVTTALTGDNTTPYIGGRGAGPTLADSLAQMFHFHVALDAMNSSDRIIFES